MALGSTIPVIVIQKIVPRIIKKMEDLNKLASLLQTKCNNLPLNIKCQDPRINDIKKLLDRLQKLIKSLKLLSNSLNKVIKTLNNLSKAATVVKLIQLTIPPGAPPGLVAEVLDIVNKLLQNIKSAMDSFLQLTDIIKLNISDTNDTMAQVLITVGSICNSESFAVSADIKQLIDDRAPISSTSATSTSATSTNNNSDSLILESDSMFYYNQVASDEDITEYIDFLNKIANDLEDPSQAVNYVDEAPTLVYSGNTPPANDIGKFGDYYIDTNTTILYGPKSSDTNW